MWPFKKKKKGVMHNHSIEIKAFGPQYEVILWENYHSLNPTIVAYKSGFNSYSQAVIAAENIWQEVKEGRTRLYRK